MHLLTIGGAEAVGLNEDVGSIEQGKRADMVAVAVPEPGRLSERQLATAVLDVGSTAVERTYVAGKQVYDANERAGNR